MHWVNDGILVMFVSREIVDQRVILE